MEQKSLIRDNQKFGSVADFLKDKITDNSDVSIVSAYFTIYAYYELKDNLDSINELRFLFGEPTFVNMNEGKNPKEFQIEDSALEISNKDRLCQKKIAKECAEWIKSKVEIKSLVKPNFLHGKLYHIASSNGVEDAIMGSSNFTTKGLGLSKSNNMELNLIVDSKNETKELQLWFNQIWNDDTGLVKDVKDEVLKYLNQLYAENSPEFIYQKTLYSIFGDYIAEQKDNRLLEENSNFMESEIWNKLYDFQKDGVKGAINKLLKHNGCIIADSVGLGKTFEALAIIKFFELKNYKVLVLCPKNLSNNWTLYQASQNNALNPFKRDRFGYTVLYHTDLGRSGKSKANSIDLATLNWAAYDLVVIDESHNFRGNPMQRTTEEGSIKLNRAAYLMNKVIKSGSKTKVLMLSATPVNTSLKDLRNQINFITEGDNSALFESAGVTNIEQTFTIAQRQFSLWADPKKKVRFSSELLENLDSSFFKVLDEFSIARSRKHIMRSYDTSQIGKFPSRLKPISVYSDIDTKNEFPSYCRVDNDISSYKLSLFNPSAYIKSEKQAYYAQKVGSAVKDFTQSDREQYLIGMMKMNYMKRLESSVHSFELSLEKTIKKIEALENKIRFFKESGKESEVESLNIDDENDDEDENKNDDFEVGKKLKINLADLELDKWLKDLKTDKDALMPLETMAHLVTSERDAKLIELKKIIQKKCNASSNKKVIIFTAFADTAEYLYNNLSIWAKKEICLESALVTGSKAKSTTGLTDFNRILLNFAPLAKNRAELLSLNKAKSAQNEKDIDILIATDCISEGQNLQDCDFLINYDIHWNPVRIIQRFGRIDRIGSKNDEIQLVNFWPTKDLDEYLNLKTRVEARMVLVDLTATGEDNLLADENDKSELTYRKEQLERLKEEVLDIEDLDNSINLTDFTLDDFRAELSAFIKQNETLLKSSPNGLYAVVPSSDKNSDANRHHEEQSNEAIRHNVLDCHTDKSARVDKNVANDSDKSKSGVIFCLRQKNLDFQNATSVNPLNPYFLVYVMNDGSIKYNYVNAKQILESFRAFCKGKKEPYQKLCDDFNDETQNGSKVDFYSALLKKGAEAISDSYKKRGASKLTNSRDGLLITKDKSLSNLDDFELVTWLVIK